MQHAKRIVIVAGEASGDAHAASFIRHLKSNHPSVEISGIGGKQMQDAGAVLIDDLTNVSATGVSEVIGHLRVIIRAFKKIKVHLTTSKPDLLILVDYPEFNLRLAKFAKRQLGIRTLFYISPQVWAWKAERIHTIRECIDHMAVIFPFEKTLYQKASVPVSFVGHPLVKKIAQSTTNIPHRDCLNLPSGKRLIALLPGSRGNEIKRHMPVLMQAAEKLNSKFSDLHFIFPVASTIKPDLIKSYLTSVTFSYSFSFGKTIETMACSDCVVVASGTASLECALLAKPMCIIYKSSWLTAFAAFKLIKIKYLGLCNILQNAMVVPELLQYDCNPQELTRVVEGLLTDQPWSQRMEEKLRAIKNSLSAEQADCSIHTLIEKELFGEPDSGQTIDFISKEFPLPYR